MKSIYYYVSYRAYINDYYLNEKNSRASGFTYADFAKEAKLSSSNYMKLIASGSRNLTISNIHQVADCMRIIGDELSYFEALVLEEQAKTDRERNYYSARRMTLRSTNSKNHISRSKTDHRIRGNERAPLLLAAIGRDTRQTIHLCRTEYGYSDLAILKEIDRLLAEKILIKTETGCFELARSEDSKHRMLSDKKTSNLAQRQHLANGLREANEMFQRRYDEGNAKFLSIFLTAEPGSLQKIFDELRQSVEKIGPQFEPSPGHLPGVYRVQVQCYRMKSAF